VDNKRSSEVFRITNEPAFERKRLLTSGKMDAFRFAWESRYDLSLLRTEIHKTEEQISNPAEPLKGAMSPGASPRIYKDGYLAGLKDALRILSAETDELRSGVRIEALSALLHQMLLADGRMDAFRFAWETRGDLPQLQARMHEIEERIFNSPKTSNDILLPGVGSGAYLEGYQAGLGDIVETLSNPNR